MNPVLEIDEPGSDTYALMIHQSIAAVLDVPQDFPQVVIRVDGRPMLVTFELDGTEHSRRVEGGLGAVVSRPLLHALWLCPSHGTVPTAAVPTEKLSRLRDHPGQVEEIGGTLRRLYSPPGRVTGLVISGRRPDGVVDATVMQSPVFRRAACIRRKPDDMARLAQRAIGAGIGLINTYGTLPVVVVPAPPPLLGVPGVYRWWLAELAYESWTQDKTQPVNWALGLVGPRPPRSYRAAAALQNSRNVRRRSTSGTERTSSVS